LTGDQIDHHEHATVARLAGALAAARLRNRGNDT